MRKKASKRESRVSSFHSLPDLAHFSDARLKMDKPLASEQFPPKPNLSPKAKDSVSGPVKCVVKCAKCAGELML